MTTARTFFLLLIAFRIGSVVADAQNIRILPRFTKGMLLDYQRCSASWKVQHNGNQQDTEKERDTLTVAVEVTDVGAGGSVTLLCAKKNEDSIHVGEEHSSETGSLNVIRISASQATPPLFLVTLDSIDQFITGSILKEAASEIQIQKDYPGYTGESDSRRLKRLINHILFKLDIISRKTNIFIGDRWIDSLAGPVTTSSHIFPRIKTTYHSVDADRTDTGVECIRYSIREIRTPWNPGEEPSKGQWSGISETTFLLRKSDGCLLQWESTTRFGRGNISRVYSADDIVRAFSTEPEERGIISFYFASNERVVLVHERE